MNFHCAGRNEVFIYTDGSKFNRDEGVKKVGAACWVPTMNIVEKCKLNNMSSSFTAEAIAIIRANALIYP